MAFSYTTDWQDRDGKMVRTGGTWSAASATSGTISFGPINGLSIGALVAGYVTNSVSATTQTAVKMVVGSATTQNTLALTCVSNDKGWWEAKWLP